MKRAVKRPVSHKIILFRNKSSGSSTTTYRVLTRRGDHVLTRRGDYIAWQ